jgi:hypothetical protein
MQQRPLSRSCPDRAAALGTREPGNEQEAANAVMVDRYTRRRVAEIARPDCGRRRLIDGGVRLRCGEHRHDGSRRARPAQLPHDRGT